LQKDGLRPFDLFLCSETRASHATSAASRPQHGAAASPLLDFGPLPGGGALGVPERIPARRALALPPLLLLGRRCRCRRLLLLLVVVVVRIAPFFPPAFRFVAPFAVTRCRREERRPHPRRRRRALPLRPTRVAARPGRPRLHPRRRRYRYRGWISSSG